MRGDPEIIDALNAILTSELTAINQYFIHFRMLENWGYKRIAKKKREESIEEMKHADRVIDRILYLDGVPNMQRLSPVRVGEEPVEMHRLDLERSGAEDRMAGQTGRRRGDDRRYRPAPAGGTARPVVMTTTPAPRLQAPHVRTVAVAALEFGLGLRLRLGKRLVARVFLLGEAEVHKRSMPCVA